MAAKITEGVWAPLPGALPDQVEPNNVYVIPTRAPAEGSDVPRYTDTVRYLPKEARDVELPVQFSKTTDSRKFLSEYSVDPDTWSLGLACLQMANAWLILTVSLFIDYRAKAQGWSKNEASELPLRVCVAETDTGRNYEIEGSGTDVLEALKALQTRGGESEKVVNGSKKVLGQEGGKHVRR